MNRRSAPRCAIATVHHKDQTISTTEVAPDQGSGVAQQIPSAADTDTAPRAEQGAAAAEQAPASDLDWRAPYGFVSKTALDALAKGGYRVPSPGGQIRVAFVGQTTYFDVCALAEPALQLEPEFVEFRSGADLGPVLKAIEQHRPHVVFVFRPELIPSGAFSSLSAVTLGYFTEPLPRPDGDLHPDLGRRLGYLDSLDGGNFDRLVSFDPLIADTVARKAPRTGVWRSFPLPVADYLYAPVRRSERPPRALFIGRSTEHRELFLETAKHTYDILHVAHGVSGRELVELLSRFDISINIHNERYPTFENRVSLSMAAGHLVLSEPLSPTHGLEPGIDYVELKVPRELDAALFNLKNFPDLYHRQRVSGRMKAEQFRASRVYPRIIDDLLLDLATFGSARKIVD